ncbi:MAG: 30S ribosomal protein S3ae [Candidatus Aenigmarchaeota archaeon]|nr:30S ribosomal protein S3ae [Candidatus Aenigmarchaeota archaeon]MDI6722256.1 30S ribosomal protein S3ae [Candidatus Aenigmarchaeota archaeon]
MALKKKWYEIVSPKMFGEKKIGETLSVDPSSLIGRKIEVSMLEIANNYQRFYIKPQFQIVHVEGDKALTKFIGHDVMRERVYRMVQLHGRRVDCIQEVTTKDGVKVRVKTVFILIKRVGTSMKNSCRAYATRVVEDAAKETGFEDFVKMIVEGELQQRVRREVTKIYPVGNIEIRKTEVIGDKPVAEKKRRRKVAHEEKNAKGENSKGEKAEEKVAV